MLLLNFFSEAFNREYPHSRTNNNFGLVLLSWFVKICIYIKVYLRMHFQAFRLFFSTIYLVSIIYLFRSSRPKVYCKKGVLGKFAKFTGKHLCQTLFFNKVADLRPATLLKNRLWHRSFPVNFMKFLGTSFSRSTSGWLLLFNFIYDYPYHTHLMFTHCALMSKLVSFMSFFQLVEQSQVLL